MTKKKKGGGKGKGKAPKKPTLPPEEEWPTNDWACKLRKEGEDFFDIEASTKEQAEEKARNKIKPNKVPKRANVSCELIGTKHKK